MGSAVNSLSSFGGMKNRIINGNMRFDQRNEGGAVTPSATNALQYIIDRWRYTSTQASKFTIQKQSATPPVGFTNYQRATVAATAVVGAGDAFGINQFIEAFNVSDFLLGSANAVTFTVSMWVRSSVTGSFGAAIRTGDGSNYSYPFSISVPVANTWTYISVPIPGPTAGTWGTGNATGMDLWISLSSGSTFLGPGGAWAAANYVAPTGSTNLVTTNGATFDFTGVQVEIGSVATPFERRMVAHELYLAQRYYEKSYDQGVGPASNSENGASQYFMTATTYRQSEKFKVTKRATPTVVVYSTVTGATAALRNRSSNVDVTGVSQDAVGYSGYSLSVAITANAQYSHHFTADAEL